MDDIFADTRGREADLFKLAAGFGPSCITLGLSGITGTIADPIMAAVGTIASTWVLLTSANVLTAPPVTVTFKQGDTNGNIE